MKKLLLPALIIFLFSISIVNAWEINVISTVTYVVDGDSFKITGDEVRLADVSAPEWNESGGTEATNALKNLINGKKVFLDTDQKTGRDPHGRLVAVVYIKHNTTHYKNVNYILWKEKDTVSLTDYPNNEFNPDTWTKFVRYAEDPEPEPEPEPIPTPTPKPTPKPPEPKEYELTFHAFGEGSYTHNTGTSIYEEKTEVTIFAYPDTYWRIQKRILDETPIGSGNSIQLTMDKNHTLIVLLEKIPQSANLSFTVVDESNKPITNATIKSVSQPPIQEKILLETNQEGYAFTNLIYWGDYTFNISKQDYKQEQVELELQKNTILDITSTLKLSSLDIRIQIIDSNGQPIKNATIQSINQPTDQPQVTGITDVEGYLLLEDVEPGYYSFEVTGDYITAKQFNLYSLSEPYLEYLPEISYHYDLKLLVNDEKGVPLSDVSVTSIEYPVQQTALNGIFNEKISFYELLSGNYTFQLSKDGFVTLNVSIPFFGAGYQHVETVVLSPTPRNLTPVLFAGFFLTIIGYTFYQEIYSKKKINKPIKTLITEKAPSRTVHHPRYLDTDKGIIIQTLYSTDGLSLVDLKSKTKLENTSFWSCFYDLLESGELESNHKGEFLLSEKISKDWEAYYDSEL